MVIQMIMSDICKNRRMINWKKKTSIFIGRFQPFHKGHKVLFLKTLKNSGQVAILIMDSHNVGIKNPLKFNEVKRKHRWGWTRKSYDCFC